MKGLAQGGHSIELDYWPDAKSFVQKYTERYMVKPNTGAATAF
jgi:hypothetical protein